MDNDITTSKMLSYRYKKEIKYYKKCLKILKILSSVTPVTIQRRVKEFYDTYREYCVYYPNFELLESGFLTSVSSNGYTKEEAILDYYKNLKNYINSTFVMNSMSSKKRKEYIWTGKKFKLKK